MKELLFSSEGRINRSRWWLTSIGAAIALGVVYGILLAIMWAVAPGTVDANGGFSVTGAMAIPYIIVTLAYFILSLWFFISLGAKRYHDLDKPGMWLLIILIPIIGPLIYLVQCGFMRGTVGPNKYGPDPLMGSV